MTDIYIEPFDFRTIFLEYFIGDGTLFAFLFVLLYSFAAAKFNFTNKVYFFGLILCGILYGAFIGWSIFLVILIIFGAAIFKLFARIFT